VSRSKLERASFAVLILFLLACLIFGVWLGSQVIT